MAVLASILSCSSGKEASASAPQLVANAVQPLSSKPLNTLPKAVIYKMNGDYSQLVPVNLDASGKQLLSYPAPTDLTESSTPISIGNGWYLDRRGGVGKNTAFLKYTYAQYMALPAPPSQAELLSAIDPKATVTEVKVLPITLSQALSDTAVLKQYAL